jgi:hypothetical protein
MELPQCPKAQCFHWILPGGYADMSGGIYKDIKDSFAHGDWKAFPEGGCSCTSGKCLRLFPDGTGDFFEPLS